LACGWAEPTATETAAAAAEEEYGVSEQCPGRMGGVEHALVPDHNGALFCTACGVSLSDLRVLALHRKVSLDTVAVDSITYVTCPGSMGNHAFETNGECRDCGELRHRNAQQQLQQQQKQQQQLSAVDEAAAMLARRTLARENIALAICASSVGGRHAYVAGECTQCGTLQQTTNAYLVNTFYMQCIGSMGSHRFVDMECEHCGCPELPAKTLARVAAANLMKREATAVPVAAPSCHGSMSGPHDFVLGECRHCLELDDTRLEGLSALQFGGDCPISMCGVHIFSPAG
jgi:hypothetical protein